MNSPKDAKSRQPLPTPEASTETSPETRTNGGAAMGGASDRPTSATAPSEANADAASGSFVGGLPTGARCAYPPRPTAPADFGPEPIVRLEGVGKTFGRVQANRDVSLDIKPGVILALLGENGAGKSTLMSILAGRLVPDAGRIVVDGRPTAFGSAKDAIDAGIGMVYQHFMLVERMTVAENVLLGQEDGFLLKPAEMRQRVASLARTYGLPIDPGARVRSLSMGERQRVEILKLLYRQSRVLIFDEPTAVLTPSEAGQLFGAMRAMARQGKAIVFISHKLEEVLAVADEIAILRQGKVVADFPASQTRSKAELACLMVGKEVLLEVDRPPVAKGETVLEIERVSGEVLEDVTLSLRQGEIMAVVGVAGNGQKELVETICGLREPSSGKARILGESWGQFFRNPSWRRSLSYIPEDRLGLAVAKGLNLVDNFLLTTRAGFSQGPLLDKKSAQETTARLIQEYGVAGGGPDALAWQLSGGNLQKLVLAREFFRQSRLIVAEQPTQGLDIASTEEVWRQLVKARAHAGVLLVTSDLTEALSLADRVAVIFAGRIMAAFDASDREKISRIGLLMAGVEE